MLVLRWMLVLKRQRLPLFGSLPVPSCCVCMCVGVDGRVSGLECRRLHILSRPAASR